ncbi:hypothetical protein [Acinetobacter venetianus]|uniref:hypothetical protein n=1 Tax=Acinetobacter venetianus TaxID=52133 RepID=UPI0007781D7E|nr:hypothetical protein [Acinetobacter venetianus]KXZ65687.1 hypothetical protein AVENLUH7437_01167 [Acinetobacter venetianus]
MNKEQEIAQRIFKLISIDKKGLSAYGHWGFIKLAMLLGFDKEQNEPLQSLAQSVGIQHKKLRTVLNELEQMGLICVTYINQGHLSRVRTIKLIHKNAIKKNFPLFPLISILLKKTLSIRVSSKLEEKSMDFREFLILLTLLEHSDQFGIVMGCSNKIIYQKTGLKKVTINNYLRELGKKGFLRSRAEGSIRNAFITYQDSTYSLNLSHPFWENAAIYGRFYIIKYPDQHLFEVSTIGQLKKLLENRNHNIEFPKDENLRNERILQNLKMQSYFCLSNNIHYNQLNYRNAAVFKRSSLPFSLFVECLSKLEKIDSVFLEFIRYKKIGCTKECEEKLESLQVDEQQNKDKLEILSNDATLQCYLEQHTSQIYSNTGLLHQLLSVEGESFSLNNKFTLFAYMPHYLLYQKKLASSELFQQTFQNLILSLLELIANNQIYFYLIIATRRQHRIFDENNKHKAKGFRILPRSKHQHRYSCIFVPEPTLTSDQYFLGELALLNQHVSSESTDDKEYAFDDEQIYPSQEDLVEYGLCLMPKPNFSA